MCNRHTFVVFLGLIAFCVSITTNAFDKAPLAHNANLLRQEFINIDVQKIDRWLMLKEGDRINLPWFDGGFLPVTVEENGNTDQFRSVSGSINADHFGSALLTIGDNVLTGVIIKDGESYRLRSVGHQLYSLTQINPNNWPYQDDAMTHSDDHLQLKTHDYNQQYTYEKKNKRSAIEIVKHVENGHDLAKKLIRTEDGSRIDILIAYTTESADWALRNGLDINAEISNMMDLTNKSLGYSGVQVFLNHVGTVEVEHTVLDPIEFITDMNELTSGPGFQDLRLLRSQLKADLVSLLVFNGEHGCTHNNGLACGAGWIPRDFMQPKDFKEYGFGEESFLFGRDGFSTVNIYNAFNGYLFMHEIGHNLGAGHDKFTHITRGEDPTVDVYARGWVMIESRMTTLMSHHDLCDLINYTCRLIPFYSNPLNSYVGGVNGNPVPGQQPDAYLGPADNVSAMNRMKRTVANYKRNFPGT